MAYFNSDRTAARKVSWETPHVAVVWPPIPISIGQVPMSLFLPPDAPFGERTLNRYREFSADTSRGLSNFFKPAGQPRQLEVEVQ